MNGSRKYRWAKNGVYWGFGLAAYNFVFLEPERSLLLAHWNQPKVAAYMPAYFAVFGTLVALIGLALGAFYDWRTRRKTHGA